MDEKRYPVNEEGCAQAATELQFGVVPEQRDNADSAGLVFFLHRSNDVGLDGLNGLVFDWQSVKTGQDSVALCFSAARIVPTGSIRQHEQEHSREDSEAALEC